MNLTVGYIPYLNMVPFHHGFGPQPIQREDLQIQFRQVSPRALGLEAEAGRIDAGAMSLMDTFRLADRFEPLGDFGIGVKNGAGSVLLFSKGPLSTVEGICAVTDETATSVRLLQVLLEKRYGKKNISYGRVASYLLYDGSAEALLLIGDEALRAKRDGIKGLPMVTDLAETWLQWQRTPFVFARWVVRKDLPEAAKELIYKYLENSLNTNVLNREPFAKWEATSRGLGSAKIQEYWDGFCFKLTSGHAQSIERFREYVGGLTYV